MTNAADPAHTGDSPLQAAIEAHKGGRLPEAAAAYRAILQHEPGNGDALNFLGMLTCQSGDLQGAIPLLRKSVEVLPGNPHAWVNLANLLLLAGDAAEARTALTKATELAPDMALAWYNLGVCLGRCQAPDEAAAALHRALQLEPGHLPAYESLAILLYRLGNYAEGAQIYREWLEHDPGNPIPRHMLAATSGEGAPARADDRFVKQIFDDFASSFEECLSKLGYRAPQLVADVLASVVPPGGRAEILDAGCGTGLCAPLVRSLARRLVGVDLSDGMLEHARKRGLYDELTVGELSQFMRSRPKSFDVVLSADTLCYFGALEEPLEAARGCLREAGVLAFTLERLDPADSAAPYRLEPHGRYSHSEEYVRNACAEAGFANLALTTDILRREKGANVTGHVVLATVAP